MKCVGPTCLGVAPHTLVYVTPTICIVYDRGLDSGVERAGGSHRVMPEIARLAGLVAAGCLVPKNQCNSREL